MCFIKQLPYFLVNRVSIYILYIFLNVKLHKMPDSCEKCLVLKFYLSYFPPLVKTPPPPPPLLYAHGRAVALAVFIAYLTLKMIVT